VEQIEECFMCNKKLMSTTQTLRRILPHSYLDPIGLVPSGYKELKETVGIEVK
jgi:hypothetical protein